MKKSIQFFFLFFLFIVLSGKAQSVISGKVLDDNDQSLSGATIMISKDSTSSILAYGISDGSGNFNIQLKSNLETLFLKISYIGYSTRKQEIQNKDQQLEVKLFPSSEELKEVLVEARIIEQRGDTLNFSVSAFKDQKDRVIADVSGFL